MSNSRDAMFDDLHEQVTQARLTRRQVLRRAAVLGLSVPAVSGLLAACGGDDDDSEGDPTAATGGNTDATASGGMTPSPATGGTDASPQTGGDATATTGGSGTGAVDTGGDESISVRVNADLQTADPALVGDPSDHALSLLIYNGLVRFETGSLEIVPDLATDWEISDDALTYRFNMREGVKFQKGYGDCTAEDVVYTIERIRDPEVGSTYAANLERLDTVTAVDPLTVEFMLTEPYSPFLGTVLAFRPGWIVSQQAVEEKGEDFGLDPIGTGAFMWDSRSAGTEVVLKRNPDYFEPVDIEEVHVRFVAEDSVAELALQSGDLDVAYIYQAESTERLLNDDGDDIEAKQIPSYRTQWAGFNLSSEKMQDINVRKAIIHAIDKPAAAAGVAGDMAQAVSSIFNPLTEGYIDPDPFPYDPQLAQQLLADAGFPDGIDIDVLVIPSSTWPDLAVIVQAQWAEVGIRANLLTPERAVYDEMIDTGEGFDIGTLNLTRTDPYQYAERFLSTNIPSPNYQHYDNPEYDELVLAAVREADQAARIELWEQIQMQVLVEDVVGFGMTNINYIIAWNNKIEGVDSIYLDSYYVPKMSIA